MFRRKIIDQFRHWAEQPKHKPLILRGARQVGKTTIDLAPETEVAIRLYAGNLSLDSLTTISGKKFQLLNLPYYLSDQLDYWIGTLRPKH